MSAMASPRTSTDRKASISSERERTRGRARAIERAAAEQRRLERQLNALAHRLWRTPRTRSR